MTHSAPLLLATLAAVAGCRDESYSYADTSAQLGDTTAVLDLTGGIKMAEGSASSAIVTCHIKDGDTLPGLLQSADPTILRIDTAATDTTRSVFLAVKAGATNVSIQLDGRTVGTVSATVSAPPPYTLPEAGPPPATVDGGEGGAPDGGAG